MVPRKTQGKPERNHWLCPMVSFRFFPSRRGVLCKSFFGCRLPVARRPNDLQVALLLVRCFWCFVSLAFGPTSRIAVQCHALNPRVCCRICWCARVLGEQFVRVGFCALSRCICLFLLAFCPTSRLALQCLALNPVWLLLRLVVPCVVASSRRRRLSTDVCRFLLVAFALFFLLFMRVVPLCSAMPWS